MTTPSFTKKTWVNGPSGGTPLNDDALNDLEERVSSAVETVVATAPGVVDNGDGTVTVAGGSGGGGGGLVTDATTSVKGVMRLAGDLAGTAALPTVPGLGSKAPIDSPHFTGSPTAPTPAGGDNDTSIATTAYVQSTLAGLPAFSGAPLDSPAFTGTPTAPTPTSPSASDTQLATTKFVNTASSLAARVAALEGTGGGGSGGTVTRIGSVSTDGSNGATGASQTLTVTCPAGVTVGDLMIAGAADQTASSTVSAPSGWTQLDAANIAANPAAAIWTRVATSADVAGTTTYTWTFGAGRASLALAAYRNAAIDSHAVSTITTAATGLPLPTVTTTVAADQLLGFVFARTASTGGATMTPPSGWTEQVDWSSNSPTTNNLVMQVITKTAGAAGAQTATSTISAASTAICCMVALRPAVTGGSGGTGLPTQTGNAGKALVTNGTTTSWGYVSSVDGVNTLLGWRVVTDPTYGAVGNGTTNDTAAIAAAYNACPAGGIVFFPPGKTYLMSTGSPYVAALAVAKPITLVGGAGATLKAATGNPAGIRLVQVSAADVTISSLGFDGNGITDVTCVYASGATRLTVNGSLFQRPGAGGLHCNDACTDITFDNNHVTGQGYGVLVNEGAGHARIKISNNTFDGLSGPGDAIEINGTINPRYDVTVVGNTIANYVDSGPASGFGIGYSRVIRGSITGNVITNCSRNGIHIENLCLGITVSGNTVSNCRHAGIEVQGEAGQTSSMCTISGNTIIGCCTAPTIHLGNGGIDIGSSTGSAFAGFGATGMTVYGNIIDGCQGAGIYAFQVSNSVIANNIIRNTYGSSTDTANANHNTGIEAVSCYNTDFVGNRIFDDQSTKTQYYPIYFYGGNTGTRCMLNNVSGNIAGITDLTPGVFSFLNGTSRPTVTGAKAGNAALTDLLGELANALGLVTDSST